MGTEEDERREHIVLEDHVRDLVNELPRVPERKVVTTGGFWLVVMKIRTSLKILDVIREIANERTG